VADHRVRVVRQEGAGAQAACRSGLTVARGRWAVVLDPDTEVSAAWLARIGRLADGTGAGFVSCGGEQRHLDGSVTEIRPQTAGRDQATVACLRAGAFATTTTRMLDAADALSAIAAVSGGTAGDVATDLADVTGLSGLGEMALDAALVDQDQVVATPERLVAWNDPAAEVAPEGDELRLRWAFQGLEALSRTPIPDGELLARYATIGGVAAARLRRRRDSRLLFRIACQARPEVRKHWARLAVSHVSPLSRRIWDPTAAAAEDADEVDGAAMDAPDPRAVEDGPLPVTGAHEVTGPDLAPTP
jgi:hypothetical protein